MIKWTLKHQFWNAQLAPDIHVHPAGAQLKPKVALMQTELVCLVLAQMLPVLPLKGWSERKHEAVISHVVSDMLCGGFYAVCLCVH